MKALKLLLCASHVLMSEACFWLCTIPSIRVDGRRLRFDGYNDNDVGKATGYIKLSPPSVMQPMEVLDASERWQLLYFTQHIGCSATSPFYRFRVVESKALDEAVGLMYYTQHRRRGFIGHMEEIQVQQLIDGAWSEGMPDWANGSTHDRIIRLPPSIAKGILLDQIDSLVLPDNYGINRSLFIDWTAFGYARRTGLPQPWETCIDWSVVFPMTQSIAQRAASEPLPLP